MLFPAICDVIRNLSGMWQMLFPDKYARYLDVPQNFDPEVGGALLSPRAAQHRRRWSGSRARSRRRREPARVDRRLQHQPRR
jgi:hypothetical protein